VPRQPALHGSQRAYRGAVVRGLSAQPDHRRSSEALRAEIERATDRIGPILDDDAWERIVEGLERDRLVHRADGELRLGAATIGA
jgi:hypothetical protein